jgi:hypothetical protein
LFVIVVTTLSITQTSESITSLIIIIIIIIIYTFYSDQDVIIAFSSSRCMSHSQRSANKLFEYLKLHLFYSIGQMSFVHKIAFYTQFH